MTSCFLYRAPKIRVNAVAPWVTWTPLLQNTVEGDPTGHQRESLRRAEAATPLGRCAQPHEMAGAICFFAMQSVRFFLLSYRQLY